METLYTALNFFNLIDGNNVVLERSEVYSNEVDKPTFETFFGDVSSNPTYDALSGSHTFTWNGTEYTKTAPELGYQVHFDNWKSLGVFDANGEPITTAPVTPDSTTQAGV